MHRRPSRNGQRDLRAGAVAPDTIVVKSPGAPVPPITLEQKRSFNAPMLSRKPVLHYVFARMESAEERGLERALNCCESAI